MSKKTILIILLTMLSIGIVSLYATFAIDEEAKELGNSTADYNLIYSIKENSNKILTISPHEEKYVDVTLNNPYDSTVKYGMYYYVEKPNRNPEGLTVSLAEDSLDLLQNTIKPNQNRSISIKVVNDSETQIELIVGALVGFEKGNINELIKDGEILIK